MLAPELAQSSSLGAAHQAVASPSGSTAQHLVKMCQDDFYVSSHVHYEYMKFAPILLPNLISLSSASTVKQSSPSKTGLLRNAHTCVPLDS